MRVVLAALLWLLCLNAAWAQEVDQAGVWAADATRAEAVLTEGDASDAELEALREALTVQRSAALDAQDQYRDRVATLEAQVEALAAPAEGETESAEIVAQREDLQTRLSEARAPVLEAQAAYRRADGLIAEIDAVLRARNAAFITRLEPSPMMPQVALQAVQEWNAALTTGGARLWSALSGGAGPGITARLPVLGLAILGGLALFFWVRGAVSEALSGLYGSAQSPASRAVAGMLLNAARLVIPVAAVFLVLSALRYVNPNSVFLDGIAGLLLTVAIILAVALWVGQSLFQPMGAELAILQRGRRDARSGYRQVITLGVVSAALVLVNGFYTAGEVGRSGVAIATLPIFFVASYALIRLARVLRRSPDAETGGAPFLSLLARICWLLAIAAPLAALIGYQNLAQFLTIPLIQSLALMGASIIVFAILRDALDRWLDAEGDADTQSRRARFRLLPVLVGFAMATLALPVLVLIWGARVSDLQEVWIWLRDGIAIGESRISVTDFVTFVLIFVVGYTLTRMLQAVIRNTVLPRTDMDVGGRNAIVTGIGYVGIILSAVFAISSTGLNLSNVAIVAGALSVGIGFGLQTIVSNFVSGIILLIERPIKEGDWIEVGGFAGYVRRISVRSTRIETFDRSSVIVPNAELIAGSVLNRTHANLMGRVIVPVGVAYGTDVREVERLLLEIAEGHSMVMRTPAPSVVFQGFGADSLDFEIRAFLRDVNYMLSVKSEMNYEIYAKFNAAGIEIPFRQSDVTLKNPEALRGALTEGSS